MPSTTKTNVDASPPEEALASHNTSLDYSVVVPAFNEARSLEELCQRVQTVFEGLSKSFEIIIVDDGSTDDTQLVLGQLVTTHSRVRAFRLRRNAGKTRALAVGLQASAGQTIVTMDADLQDIPEEIPTLLSGLEQGYDLVCGWRQAREDPLAKVWASRCFNLVLRWLTGLQLHDFNTGLKCFRRSVADELTLYGELHRFIPALAHLQGFSVGEVPVRHTTRLHGKSRFGAYRMVAGLFDSLTVVFLSKFRHKPLHLFGSFGILCLVGGSGINVFFLLQWFSGVPLHIRPLMVFGWVLLILGIQFISFGLLSEMITETSQRDQIAEAVPVPSRMPTS